MEGRGGAKEGGVDWVVGERRGEEKRREEIIIKKEKLNKSVYINRFQAMFDE